ncbi:MAG TPA: alcohol dehydrogenase catalytic domain-containing protein [Thermomicrobiales bacterium]|nr:alcohol dehydrogenase catalytic domain-containing protein [Thermomicrobiales bacterium]
MRRDAGAGLPATMRAAVLRGPREITVERVPTPAPGPDDVLVAVEAVGLCGSDLHLYTGERPAATPVILGHEIVGRIVAAGPRAPAGRVGERVAVEPNIPCGDCARCARGLGRICARKVSLGLTRPGGLAEYVAAPAGFAWPIPDDLPLADAATIEPAAVAVHAVARAAAPAGATVAVVGCGGVGLLVAQVARVRGHRVVAVEPHAGRRAAALAAGVARVADAGDAATVAAFFEEEGVAAVFECAGLAATAQVCLDAAPPGSRVVLVGLAAADVALNPLRFVRAELEVRGALIYDHPADFAATIGLVASGRLASGRNTAPPRPLADVADIFAALAAGRLGAKPLVIPRSEERRATSDE